MQTATIEDLAYLVKQAKEQKLPQPIVFLGAGASKTGGVPLAAEIASDILARYANNPAVKRLRDDEKTYPRLMECLTPYERNQLLKGYVNEAKINVTHIYLAQLMIDGFIDYVLTVNFDNLMLRALALYNSFPATYDMAVLKDLTTTSFKKRSVVYLHGQHHGLWLLNTVEEMDKVKEIIPPILDSIKNQRPWIFIGYSGEDPIFDHIVKLGRFDNRAFWIGYQENMPGQSVCKGLLDRPNTNACLINGYDSDSFMVKLNAELGLRQPSVIDTPFTSLSSTLENIVDIDDQEHFRGVKERLEIAKRNVSAAIQQFEKGVGEPDADQKQKSAEDLLKKAIINDIVNENFAEEGLKKLEADAKALNSSEVKKVLADLFVDAGNSAYLKARQRPEEKLYEHAIEKYRKAAELNPKSYVAFYNWGSAISDLAQLRSNEKLFEEGFEKFRKATGLNPIHVSSFYNWGSAISDLAKLKGDEKLYKEGFEKYRKAAELNPEDASTFYNWGYAIRELAELKADEKLYKESIEKFRQAAELDAEDAETFNNLGNAISDLAKLKGDEKLYEESIKKYRKAAELNPEAAWTFYNWGIAISELAKLKSDENLYEESIEAFRKAAKLDAEDAETFYNWGNATLALAKLRNDEGLFSDAGRRLSESERLGGSVYNLGRLYALKNEKGTALEKLEKALKGGEVTTDFVLADEDWSAFKEDPDFVSLVDKFKSK